MRHTFVTATSSTWGFFYFPVSVFLSFGRWAFSGPLILCLSRRGYASSRVQGAFDPFHSATEWSWL